MGTRKQIKVVFEYLCTLELFRIHDLFVEVLVMFNFKILEQLPTYMKF